MFYGENPTMDITGNGGADPGPIPVVSIPTCEHGICTTGGAMTSNCDPCVTSVCAAHPSCCATGWTGQCVDWATQMCAGVTLPKTLCDFGLFSDSTLDLSNRASTNVAIGAYGNVTMEADSYFTSIYATGNVQINSLNGKNVTMTDGIHANGYIAFQASDASKIIGNLYAGNYVDINNVDVQGNVSAMGAGTAISGSGSNGIITGTARAKNSIQGSLTIGTRVQNDATLALPVISLPPQTAGTAIPSKTTDCTGSPDQLNKTGNYIITPGKYGQVGINDGTGNSLELKGQGVYYLKALKMGNSTRLILNLNGETYSAGWDVRICNTVGTENLFYGKARVSGHATNGPPNDANGVLLDPKYLTIFYAGTNTLKIDTDVYWTGILIAPKARVEKSTMNSSPGAPLMGLPTTIEINAGTRAAPINGAIWAKSARVDTDALAKGIDPDACKAMPQIAPTLPAVTCPVTTTPKGLKTEPCVTGRDCQANSHCLAPKTEAACSHNKCATGAALVNGCDDCVTRICKVDSTCCGSTWNQSCVDKVGTICDAVCQSGDCSQNACVAGTQPIDTRCDDDLGTVAGCLDTVCVGANASCCQSGGQWTAACVTALHTACDSLVPGNTRLCDYALYASDEYTKSGAATINGGLAKQASQVDPDPAQPTINFNCAAGTTNINEFAGDQTLSPATHYNSVEMGWMTKLTFPTAGKYYFNNLSLAGRNSIILPPAPAVVEVIVCGMVYIGEDTVFTNIAAGADALRFRVYSNFDGPDAIWFYRATNPGWPVYAVSYAPYGAVRIGGNLTYNGVGWGEDVVLGPTVVVNHPTAAETACEGVPLDAGPSCPLKLVPKMLSSPGTCIANTTGYKDSSCIGYDLAAGIPCGNTVPICNHGTANFPSGSVTLGLYNSSLGQLAVETPLASALPLSPTGTCSQTLAIPAGECRDLTCATMTSGQTIMVDPLKTLSECGAGPNGRRLDNWTAYDGRSCVPQSKPNRVEYAYEANCPTGASARWSLLTWSTTTPGSAHVDFSAKVGFDAEELGVAEYVKVGAAARSPDTQECVYIDPTPCYAVLTAKLGLDTKNQGQFLNLRIDVVPDGGSPVLKDWGISYSCVDDE